MSLSPPLRKAVLTAHIVTSVGWLGAIVTYLALDITATGGQDAQLVRAAYQAMQLTVSHAIVPLALASVLIGIVNALGTPWGLVRHYWVLAKLLLTLVATTVLLLETSTVDHLARAAASGTADPRELPGTLPHSVGGLIVLLTAVFLSVFKPRGLTPYGWRHARKASVKRRP
jgi:hypothetical protein